ncbi:HEAT repeat domain-containing protein [Stieleria varia]|uniref:HEAT repeat protein n=1 Tax=Stieleria varia TaxID=2528005 RepID=A0A5C6B7X6_9BACT|nr:HEAT repeat domain-containing protein [Stieleria varia]TWU07712.1 HEAT repeat protein [Stieleria varia]
MTIHTVRHRSDRPRHSLQSLLRGLLPLVALAAMVQSGCHDGPLYALKSVNPYFTMKEWRKDAELGVTDHERREQLMQLADQIGTMPIERQRFWGKHLSRIMANDPSAEMRHLSMLAASRLKTPQAIELLEQGLDDESMKVRMSACTGLGKRPEPQAAQLLASAFGTETDQDVKNAAIAALGKHKGQIPMDSLRLALNDQDPATVSLAMSSLRGVTGKNYGTTPQQWIAALDKATPPTPDGDDAKVRMASGQLPTTR